MSVGEYVHAARTAAGISLRELSRHSGVATSFISAVEKGLASPSSKTLTRLAEALEVEPYELLGGTAPSGPHAEADDDDDTDAEEAYALLEDVFRRGLRPVNEEERAREIEALAEKLYIACIASADPSPVSKLAPLCLEMAESFLEARADWRRQHS